MFEWIKLKKKRVQAITEAIESISEDICATGDEEKNKKRAEAIRILTESLN